MSFYQTNNKILSKSINGAETIDYNKHPDLLDILFNHWICQKENYNRIKKDFNRGEFEISLKIIKDTFNISDRKARSLIKRFVENEIIMLKRKGSSSSNKSIYIYLSALEKIQENEDIVSDTVRTQSGHSEMLKNECVQSDKGHSEDMVSDTVVNNSKKELKKRIKKNIYVETSDEYRLAKYLFELIRENNPTHKEPNLQDWAKHIDRMIRLDKRKVEDIEAMIYWCQHHHFWHTAILSTGKLRERYDQLRIQMKPRLNNPVEESKGKVLDIKIGGE